MLQKKAECSKKVVQNEDKEKPAPVAKHEKNDCIVGGIPNALFLNAP